jgi:prephenate dehydratase
MRVAYLGPRGTFSEEALSQITDRLADEIEAQPVKTIREAVEAVGDGTADRALIPFENSTEGSVEESLDALASDAHESVIVAEEDVEIVHHLLARAGTQLEEVTVVISHPQAVAQCTEFLRSTLPEAEIRAASSTADAIREVSESSETWAAIGARAAGDLYGCQSLADGIADTKQNVTRFVLVAPAGSQPLQEPALPHLTALTFSDLGEDRPGALTAALAAFSDRDVNLTRIESRPLREGLGRYMFFMDLEGSVDEPAVAESLAALREIARQVRVLGSFPVRRVTV